MKRVIMEQSTPHEYKNQSMAKIIIPRHMAQSARNERIINDRIMQNHKISCQEWMLTDYALIVRDCT